MASPKTSHESLKAEAKQETVVTHNGNQSSDDVVKDHPEEDTVVSRAIEKYLNDNASVYRELQQLRAKVSELPAGLTCSCTVNTG